MNAKFTKTDKRIIYRAIDANLNRAKEGLRVAEDTARFILNSRRLTTEFKSIRHSLDSISDTLGYAALINNRDIKADVGKKDFSLELKRANPAIILIANFQRSKESLRVLEEFLKLISAKLSSQAKKSRYAIYSLEKNIWSRLRITSELNLRRREG